MKGSRDMSRIWCASARYPGKKPFTVGSIAMPSIATDEEVRIALVEHAQTFLPAGLEVLHLMPGNIFFQPEE